MPHLIEGEIPLEVDVYPGMEFQTTVSDRFTALLADLGHFEVTPVMMTMPFDGYCLNVAHGLFSQHGGDLRRLRAMYDVTVVSTPSYYVDYLRLVYGDPEFPEEIWDARMELQSIGIDTAGT